MTEDQIQQALNRYKAEHFRPNYCCECHTFNQVHFDELSSSDYCWPCLEAYLRKNPDDLIDAINDQSDVGTILPRKRDENYVP